MSGMGLRGSGPDTRSLACLYWCSVPDPESRILGMAQGPAVHCMLNTYCTLVVVTLNINDN